MFTKSAIASLALLSSASIFADDVQPQTPEQKLNEQALRVFGLTIQEADNSKIRKKERIQNFTGFMGSVLGAFMLGKYGFMNPKYWSGYQTSGYFLTGAIFGGGILSDKIISAIHKSASWRGGLNLSSTSLDAVPLDSVFEYVTCQYTNAKNSTIVYEFQPATQYDSLNKITGKWGYDDKKEIAAFATDVSFQKVVDTCSKSLHMKFTLKFDEIDYNSLKIYIKHKGTSLIYPIYFYRVKKFIGFGSTMHRMDIWNNYNF